MKKTTNLFNELYCCFILIASSHKGEHWEYKPIFTYVDASSIKFNTLCSHRSCNCHTLATKCKGLIQFCQIFLVLWNPPRRAILTVLLERKNINTEMWVIYLISSYEDFVKKPQPFEDENWAFRFCDLGQSLFV